MVPDIESVVGDGSWSTEAIDMPRACREVLDATDPLSWNSDPRNSSLSCLLSFLLLEKKDLPPDDWRALLSDPDMVSSGPP